MADERDPKVTQRYRQLGGEEPPRELDQSILAAAHRAADRPHAPLVTPAGRHRWYFALGAAAVLVLAVAVTVQLERQQPDPEVGTAVPPPTPRAEEPAREKAARQDVPKPVEPQKPAAAPKPQPGATVDRASVEERQRNLAGDAAPAAPQAMQAPSVQAESAPMPEQKAREERLDSTADLRRSRVAAARLADTPERVLERIAELRKEGRHDEADKALAEFRQRYPDYRIPQEMLQKVERRK